MDRLSVFLCGVALGLTVLLLGPVQALGATIHVPADQPTIQLGIDAASIGDTVEVAAGIYNENIIMKGGVVLQGAGPGGNPSIHSIIDGGDSGPVVTASNLNPGAKLAGFTIQNGNADIYGGGMYISDSILTISDCLFTQNRASLGGAIHSYESFLTIDNSTFSQNNADVEFFGLGGAIHSNYSELNIANCSFTENNAFYGGALEMQQSHYVLTNCTLSENSAPSGGGGIANTNSEANIINSTFSHNTASPGTGGAIDNIGGGTDLKVTYCLFSENSAGVGGGISNGGNATITYSTFKGNSATDEEGGGIYHGYDYLSVVNCTFWGNNAATSGGGIFASSTGVTIMNTILWNDSAENGPEIYGEEPISVTYSDVQGDDLYPGEGNINLEPLFIDSQNGDFHLRSSSPCIDTGNPDYQYIDPDGTRNDMGAFFFHYPTVCLDFTHRSLYEGDGDQAQPRIDEGYVVFTNTSSLHPIPIQGDIFVANINSGEFANITNSGSVSEFDPDIEVIEIEGSEHVYVAYVRLVSLGFDPNIWVIDATDPYYPVPTNITIDSPWWEGTPRMDSPYLVYALGSEANTDVWAADLTNFDEEGPFVVADGAGYQQKPAVSNGRIVYQDSSSGDSQVVLYDITTGVRTVIDKGISPEIHNNWVVYAKDVGGGDLDVFVYEISSGNPPRNITRRPGLQTNPTVWENIIAYEDNSSGNWDIYLYFINEGDTIRVTDQTADQRSPQIGEGHVVYEDNRNGNLDIFVSDFTVITCPPIETLEDTLEFFDQSVSSGELFGAGPGKSASYRLRALRNMLESAKNLIQSGLVAEACQQLLDALRRCDGYLLPPDFVTGSAREELFGMIVDLREELGC